MIELLELKKKGIRLERCSEIKDTLSLLEYANYITPEKNRKFFRKEVKLQTPYKIDAEQSILSVRVGKNCKKIKGLHGHLLAIFVLMKQYQSGILYCRYCKRTLPEQCQIVALLNFLSI